MKLFNFKKKERTQDYSVQKETNILSHSELEKKAQLGKPMTFEETEALRRFRQKDVTNQVLRLIGLLSILVIICFAVGCFLYPYSLINFLGEDAFWNCWGNIGVYLGESFSADGWVKLSEIYNGIVTDNGTVFAFDPNSTPMMNFFAIGGWTIIPLATAGLIATVVFSLYILVYNVKDLILVIKHVSHKTKDVVSDIATITKQEVSEVKENKPVQRKTRKKKEPKKEELTEDAEISKRVQEIKNEIENTEEEETPVITTAKEVVVSSTDLSSLDDEDLDKLLK